MEGFSRDFLIQEIDLTGFEVIKSQYFSHQALPSMTIWNKSISFNAASFNAFGNCECIQIMINNSTKQILIKPTNSKDNNAIAWKRRPEHLYCKMDCSLFTKQLYSSWKLDNECRYRLPGKLVQYNEKLMLLYDFQNCELWKGRKLVK